MIRRRSLPIFAQAAILAPGSILGPFWNLLFRFLGGTISRPILETEGVRSSTRTCARAKRMRWFHYTYLYIHTWRRGLGPRDGDHGSPWGDQGPRASQDGPKLAQDSVKTSLKAAKTAQYRLRAAPDGSRWPQDGPKRPPRGSQPFF